MPIDSAVRSSSGNFELLISKWTKQRDAELLELNRLETAQLGKDSAFHLRFIFVNQVFQCDLLRER